MNAKVLIGCDPEIFLRDSKGKLMSAHGVVEGTKAYPQTVSGGAVQVDGMALEINIEPADSLKGFKNNLSQVFLELGKLIPNGSNLDLGLVVADFGADFIASQPQEARDLGCEPDYNAWTASVNPRPNVDAPFRSAAGHIHIGWTKVKFGEEGKHFVECCKIVKELDLLVGLPSIFLDKETRRRELYGKAGAFRPKLYGLEYRTPSNFWLKEEYLQDWIYKSSMRAINNYLSGDLLSEKIGDIQDVINTTDYKTALEILNSFGIIIPVKGE